MLDTMTMVHDGNVINANKNNGYWSVKVSDKHGESDVFTFNNLDFLAFLILVVREGTEETVGDTSIWNVAKQIDASSVILY